MLPENKNAILYGAGGSIGGAVAREFAREGVKVFLAGRTHEKLEVIARDIEAAGGSVEVAVLDALEEQAVDNHALVLQCHYALPGLTSFGFRHLATQLDHLRNRLTPR